MNEFLKNVSDYIENYKLFLIIIAVVWILKFIFYNFIRFYEGLRNFLFTSWSALDWKSYGKWAVVTGATDGIGKAFAHELAKKQFNIVLLSRGLERLETTAKEIEDSYGVETCIIQADFATSDINLYEQISARLAGKEIGVLVNNVGTVYDYPCTFLELLDDKLDQIINLNFFPMTFMTRLVLPGMLKRKKGIIINMSTLGSFYPLPLFTVYSAAKKYVDFFSRGLQNEYQDKGIIVQCLLPSYVCTKLGNYSDILMKPNCLVPDPESFVKSAIKTTGISTYTTGYWTHGLQYWLYEYMPEWLWYKNSWILQKTLDSGKVRPQKTKRN